MDSPDTEELSLPIRCPSCGQRFKVGTDLYGRTVECGSCEHRFRIDEEVTLKQRRFYPGERKDPGLARFHRVPITSSSQSTPRPAQYGKQPQPDQLGPASPQRVIAGIVGVALILLVGLILMFAVDRGDLLDGMPKTHRVLLAVFTSLLGGVMLVYANPRGRHKAIAVSGLLGACLIALPFVFTQGTPTLRATGKTSLNGGASLKVPEESPQELLLKKLGLGPLEAERERLGKTTSELHAYGIWLENLPENNKYLVRDYLYRATKADLRSHPYPRDGKNYLMVITGVSQSLDEIAALASPLGQIQTIHRDLGVIELLVNNDNFLEGPIDKLTNKNDPAFYELNKRELDSIDLGRVQRAVQRLVDAEPKIYRSDITRRLISLLEEDGVDFKDILCKALMNWSETPGTAGEAAARVLSKLQAGGKIIPRDVVALVVKEKVTSAIPVLTDVWASSPNIWESLYQEMGLAVEPAVIARYPEMQGAVRQSATVILGKVGGKASLAVLEKASTGANAELQIIISQARKAILARQEN